MQTQKQKRQQKQPSFVAACESAKVRTEAEKQDLRDIKFMCGGGGVRRPYRRGW